MSIRDLVFKIVPAKERIENTIIKGDLVAEANKQKKKQTNKHMHIFANKTYATNISKNKHNGQPSTKTILTNFAMIFTNKNLSNA